jgi:16S rRNA (guanine527-N7)-methyltransferase
MIDHPQIEQYIELLMKWNQSYNLVSFKTKQELIIDHILDSMSMTEAGMISKKRIFDVGSGPGLPGLILSIIMPDNKYILIEPKKKYYRFLKKAVRELNLKNVTIHHHKVEEEKDIQKDDIVISRAVSGFEFFLNMRSIPKETMIIFFLGKDIYNRINTGQNQDLEILYIKKIKILEKYNKSHYIMAVKK